MSQEDSASRSSPPTTATTSTGRRARARGPDVRSSRQDAQRREAAASTATTRYFIKSPAEMDAVLQATSRRRSRTPPRSPSAVQRRAQARQDLPAEVQGPRRRRRSTAYIERSSRDRASSGASTSCTARGDEVRRATQYRERAALELGVIQKMGFSGYFLIVWDFINWAKEHGIPVGPGRGSGAGSLVAYALRITDLDPIPYNLLFERFLNPERVSMPDFDVDFCMNRRDEVIDYVSRQVRRGQRRPDRHLPPAQGARRARATSRARWACRSPRPTAREAGARAGRRARAPPIARGDRAGAASSRQLYDESPTLPRAARHRADARGPEPPRRHARRRRRDRRQAAVGVRARASARPATTSIVTQFAKDEVEKAGPGEVRLPRPQDAHRHPDRAATSINQQRRRERRAARPATRIPLDDADVYELIAARRHHRRVPARVERLHASCSRSSSPTASKTSSPPARSTARARSTPAWSTTSSTASTGARRSSTRTRCSSRSSRTPTASSSTRSR